MRGIRLWKHSVREARGTCWNRDGIRYSCDGAGYRVTNDCRQTMLDVTNYQLQSFFFCLPLNVLSILAAQLLTVISGCTLHIGITRRLHRTSERKRMPANRIPSLSKSPLCVPVCVRLHHGDSLLNVPLCSSCYQWFHIVYHMTPLKPECFILIDFWKTKQGVPFMQIQCLYILMWNMSKL